MYEIYLTHNMYIQLELKYYNNVFCIIFNLYNSICRHVQLQNTQIHPKKGFKMCYFPLKEPERCAVWIQNMKKDSWTPNKFSTLCEINKYRCHRINSNVHLYELR